MDRWSEYYLVLYSRENVVTETAINAAEPLPVMRELDELSSEKEFSDVIGRLVKGKATGSDGISSEIIKCAKPALLTKLVCHCWEEATVHQDTRDAIIITLYKNKGNRDDCNKYRGISLLSIVGKTFARVILNRLQKLAERVYPEAQCGYRRARSTSDKLFSLRQLQEKCREQQMPLNIAFIDLTKAFYLVSRSGLFQLLENIGCPTKLLSMITAFHSNMKSTVRYDEAVSNAFPIKTESNRVVSSRLPCLEPLKMASTSTLDRTASFSI